METCRGRLVQGGLLVSEDVTVQLQDDLGDWWGTLSLPCEDLVRPGARYTLLLHNGRTGQILLNTATYWDGLGRMLDDLGRILLKTTFQKRPLFALLNEKLCMKPRIYRAQDGYNLNISHNISPYLPRTGRMYG